MGWVRRGGKGGPWSQMRDQGYPENGVALRHNSMP